MLRQTLAAFVFASCVYARVYSRAENEDGSDVVYKDPNASIEDRIADLLPRMTLEEKIAQIIQGDITGYMNFDDPADNTHTYNETGLEETIRLKGGAIWGGYAGPWEKFVYGVEIGQRYLMENTTLGIPALIQSEGIHGFSNNGTTFPSAISLGATWNPELLQAAAGIISTEAEGQGINHIFAPVLDLARELRWGRVEETYGEDHFHVGVMGKAYVDGIQEGTRRNVTGEGIRKRMAATCKHFAAFGSPQGGLNLAQVTGGERELRTTYLPAFEYACMESLSMMSAYSSYDGVPAIANSRLMKGVLREEWGWPYFMTTDAGSVDLLITLHGTCETRECAAKTTLENGLSAEMGGGTFTYFTLQEQIEAGLVDESFVDQTVETILRAKFTLGLFENPYPYEDYRDMIRREDSRETLHDVEVEAIVLLENKNTTLPLSPDVGSIALIGPHANKVIFGDYVFENATQNGITPYDGITRYLSNISSSATVNYALGCDMWSYSQDNFPEALELVQNSDVAVVMVGTWSQDQTNLWIPGSNATTGEHVDNHDLALFGAQLELVKAVQAVGKPTVVVFVSGKPIAEPWIKDHVDAVVQQFYPGELGGTAIAEVLFGAENPSGKLPVSFPQHVGTAPAFYNYLKGGRPTDPGMVLDDGTVVWGHQYVISDPTPLWSFGRGLSYTIFNYTDLSLSSETIGTSDDFNVTVTVSNTGDRAGKEVVQVYITDKVSSIVTANQQLVAFAKVSLEAGESQEVSLEVKSKQLGLWSIDSEWIVEPGEFEVKVGTSEEVFMNTTLTVQ